MPNRLDELFAPERLRRNWQKTKKNAGMPSATATEDKSPLDIFMRLQGLIKGRFSGDDGEVLRLLLEELHSLLIDIFPTAEKNLVPVENRVKMIPPAHDVLNRIEDIIEAFEIAARRR
jgi:hypothetical protein